MGSEREIMTDQSREVVTRVTGSELYRKHIELMTFANERAGDYVVGGRPEGRFAEYGMLFLEVGQQQSGELVRESSGLLIFGPQTYFVGKHRGMNRGLWFSVNNEGEMGVNKVPLLRINVNMHYKNIFGIVDKVEYLSRLLIRLPVGPSGRQVDFYKEKRRSGLTPATFGGVDERRGPANRHENATFERVGGSREMYLLNTFPVYDGKLIQMVDQVRDDMVEANELENYFEELSGIDGFEARTEEAVELTRAFSRNF